MDAKLKAKWVKALRSGEYVQGTGSLYNHGRYCCLGVLACVYNGEKQSEGAFGTAGYNDSGYGIATREVGEEEKDGLAIMNDNGIPFELIAGFIQENL